MLSIPQAQYKLYEDKVLEVRGGLNGLLPVVAALDHPYPTRYSGHSAKIVKCPVAYNFPSGEELGGNPNPRKLRLKMRPLNWCIPAWQCGSQRLTTARALGEWLLDECPSKGSARLMLR